MTHWKAVGGIVLAVAATALAGSPVPCGAEATRALAQDAAPSPDSLDMLLAPVALYPDQLLAPMLLSAGNPGKVAELSAFLKQNTTLKGTALQEAAQKAGFEPSFVALAPFPQVVDLLASDPAWTAQIGQAFAANRAATAESIQRLRAQSQAIGTLKSTPQQTVETRTTTNGQEVIVIEPANPQVVYVPQYNPQVVYTQAPSTTVVVQENYNEGAAVAAGVIGFTAGIAIGAAIDNDYYYGRYGWNDWDDIYDDREDAREDYYEHREDAREDYYENRDEMASERSERANTAQQERTERQQTRQESQPRTQEQRTQQRTEAQASAQQARSSGSAPQRTSTASAQSRGYSSGSRTSGERSGTRSDAFSGYSSGSSTRSASSRGQRSRSSSGGGRSRGRR